MTAVEAPALTVALIGNPNTGKSTIFNALAGARQRIGNYPGVTVEKKTGQMTHGGQAYNLVDLPGTYSLAPRSPDEMVAVDVLLGRRDGEAHPNAVLCIVDASNLERNLYLTSQVLELGLPTVVALNMIDLARSQGIVLNVDQLEKQLGVPVVPVQANKKIGIGELKEALIESASQPAAVPPSPFPIPFQEEVARLEAWTVAQGEVPSSLALPRYLLERLLLDTGAYLESTLFAAANGIAAELRASRERLTQAGCPVPAVEAMARYAWVARVLEGVIERPASRPTTWTDRLDRVLTHRVWGTLVFSLLMVVVFESVFAWAAPAMDLVGRGMELLSAGVSRLMPEGAFRSLLVDGVLAGFGNVVTFLPQIFILFFFMAILEDCGYMARAAFLMDRLMSRVGLNGKSFIPLLSSFACAVPGVMATRVIENRRDRMATILVAPLMSCSARLPVYTVMIGAFVPPVAMLGGLIRLQGLTLFLMYLIGIVTAVIVALVLKKTLLRGPTPAFVMELPSYKLPSPSMVLYRMVDRGWAFIRRAGTLIVAVSVAVWAALYYPHDEEAVEGPFRGQRALLEQRRAAHPEGSAGRAAFQAQLDELELRISGEYQRQSLLGRLGHWIEPAVRPLGWDWRIGCAVIASFPAREVVVATLGVIYNQGREIDVDNPDDSSRLQSALRAATWDGTGQPVFTVPVALSIMVFFSLCAQCGATLAVIKRETNSWRWPIFTFAYMTTLAYVASFAVYQLGTRLLEAFPEGLG
jgi:ferrous iron transport protein B